MCFERWCWYIGGVGGSIVRQKVTAKVTPTEAESGRIIRRRYTRRKNNADDDADDRPVSGNIRFEGDLDGGQEEESPKKGETGGRLGGGRGGRGGRGRSRARGGIGTDNGSGGQRTMVQNGMILRH